MQRQYVTNEATLTEDRSCAACEVGTFSTGENESTYNAMGTCAAGTVETAASTATSDPECTACISGEYCSGGVAPAESCVLGSWDHDADPATACAAHTDCVAGEYVSAEGSASVPQECSACVTGFTAAQNANSCTAWRDCVAGEEIAGTDTSNAECGGVSVKVQQV